MQLDRKLPIPEGKSFLHVTTSVLGARVLRPCSRILKDAFLFILNS